MKQSFLMCPPDYYETTFLFNPWLPWWQEVDKEKAKKQWQNLKKEIQEAGGKIELIEPDFFESAMVFVRDNALVFDRKKVLILRSYGLRGKREPKILARFFKKKNWQVYFLPKKYHLEGGNIVFLTKDKFLAGWREGESIEAYEWLIDFLKKQGKKLELILVKLIDKKYLHLDMVLAPLLDRGFLIYPWGLNLGKNWQSSFLWQKRPVILLREEEYFGANLIIVGKKIITSQLSEETKKQIEKLGFEIKSLDLSEFHKAGGGAHCLTLDLVPSWF